MKRLIETGDVEGIERSQTRVHGCSNKQYLSTHVGSEKERKDVAQKLNEAGADLNQVDSNGTS